MPYSVMEHTADVGLELSAPTLPELFSEALRGMADIVTDAEALTAAVERSVELEADAPELLLIELLGEALYRFEVDGELFWRARVEVREGSGSWSLRGAMIGERLDPDRHPHKVAIKAVTYHRLEVREGGEGWTGRVIFDI